jgi:hypothetical protein
MEPACVPPRRFPSATTRGALMLAVAGGADTDVGAPMIDLIDNRTLLIVGCTALVLTGLIGVLSAIFLAWREDARRRQLVAVSEVTRDWQPTWKINAVTDAWVMEHQKDDIPSNFVLRIEENRMVRDIGGGEVMEIRWRPPTKAEVREIVRRYHDVPNEATVAPFDVIEFENPAALKAIQPGEQLRQLGAAMRRAVVTG